MKASLNITRTRRERQGIINGYKKVAVGIALYLAAVITLTKLGRFWTAHPVALGKLAGAIAVCYGAWLASLVWRILREANELRAEDRRLHPELFEQDKPNGRFYEYRSATKLLGILLAHIQFGPSESGAKTVVGWIAVGERAVGILFGCGAFSCGLISVGAVSAGLFSAGALSLGLISMGSVAVGLLAGGSMAAGLITLGPVSAAWVFAMGPRP